MNIRSQFFQFQAQTSPFPLAVDVVSAKGSYLFDTDGKKYIDLISGIAVSNVGHCHRHVVEAVCQQAATHMHVMVYGEYIQSPQVKLASRIAHLLPKPLSSVYLVNSGAEAVEGAMKLAKRYTGRTEIISCINAYHGSTQGALSLMGDETYKQAFRPLIPGISHIRFNEFEDLQRITTNTAAVFVEPVQGEAGVILPVSGYLQALRKRCFETNTLLVFDEIQTGFGRTGSMFACQRFGVIPDIILLAKGMGGGMPIGAFVASPAIMSSLSHDPILGHITTFGGHPVSCAAALATLEVIETENLLAGIKAREEIIFERMTALPCVRAVRHCGLMIAVEIDSFDSVLAAASQAMQKGVLIDWFLFNQTSIRIAPPLTIAMEDLETAIQVLENVLCSISEK